MPYVYVMNRANGHLKIGFSTDPYRRLSEVYGARSVLATWSHDGAFRIEQIAHRLLATARQDGEWFGVDRYTAFDAVVRAMREYDDLAPAERLVDMSEDFDIPAPPGR